MNRNLRNAWIFTKKAVGAFFNGLADGIDKVMEIRTNATPIACREDPGTDIFLIDANVAREIKWMSPEQLRAMFAGRKAKMSGEPEAWKAMKWMSPEQLKAIFGNGGPKA